MVRRKKIGQRIDVSYMMVKWIKIGNKRPYLLNGDCIGGHCCKQGYLMNCLVKLDQIKGPIW